MSTDVNIHIGNYEDLIAKWIEHGAKDRKFLEVAMDVLGYHIGDQYIIIYNQLYEDVNPACILTQIIDDHFGLEDDGSGDSTFEILLDNTKTFDYISEEEALKQIKKRMRKK
jgi:hypothetical protein